MKKFTIILFFILGFPSFNIGHAQTWDSVGRGVIGLGWNFNHLYQGVDALCVYNGNLFAGGTFDTAGNTIPVPGIAEWNGTSWDSLKLRGGEGATAFLVYNGNLVALGNCPSLPGVGTYIGQWNGSNWDSIGFGIQTEGQWGAYLFALGQYNGDLYASGSFVWDYCQGVAKWNGSTWDSLPDQLKLNAMGNEIFAMVDYNGKLYVGGRFNFNGISNIAAWNDTMWSALGKGISGYGLNGCILALTVYNGKLYTGGYFDSAGGKPAKNIAVWDGNTWSALGSGIDSAIYALGVYNNVLVVGGTFDTAAGIACSNIAEWNDTAWSAMGKGIKLFKYGAVNALCVYNGSLYAGGYFDSAGGIYVNNIARWGPPAASDTTKIYTGPLRIYPNPSKNIFTIQLPAGSGPSTIKIYNVLGQEIYFGALIPGGENFEINLGIQSAGVYLYKVTLETGEIIGQGKLIIQK